jgi:hypothetical protein
MSGLDILLALYALTVLLAAGRTLSEAWHSPNARPTGAVVGVALCAVWPLLLAGMVAYHAWPSRRRRALRLSGI